MELSDIETVRARWRRWRQAEKLFDPTSEDFAQGGLAELIPDQTSRLLILPADPDAHLVDFDDEFWSWWDEEFEDPATGTRRKWGPNAMSTADAALVGSEVQDGQWARYLALHRSGGLSVGLGRDGSFSRDDDETRYFFLTAIVARCWAAISRFSAVVERFALEAPWELSLALAGAESGSLGGVAEGWAEPGTFGHVDRYRPLAGVLIRREVEDWPGSAEEIRALAFSIGAQIEDSWGYRQRRFLANRGDYEGAFDPRVAQWH